MPQDFFFLKVFGHFVLLVSFEILSRYPNIDGFHCFKADVQWIIVKVFRDKTCCLNDFNTFFSHFFTELLVFACVCCCFHSHKTYCDI